MLDLIRAHKKAILALVTVLLVQVVDSETTDWIVAVIGVLLTGGIPNDQDAVDRVYRKRRR